MHQYYVYILASAPNGTLYIGVTNNLIARTRQHKEKTAASFTKKYNINKLVYYEISEDIESAIIRETNLKNWKRDWKLRLINEFNPEWKDLYDEINVNQ